MFGAVGQNLRVVDIPKIDLEPLSTDIEREALNKALDQKITALIEKATIYTPKPPLGALFVSQKTATGYTTKPITIAPPSALDFRINEALGDGFDDQVNKVPGLYNSVSFNLGKIDGITSRLTDAPDSTTHLEQFTLKVGERKTFYLVGGSYTGWKEGKPYTANNTKAKGFAVRFHLELQADLKLKVTHPKIAEGDVWQSEHKWLSPEASGLYSPNFAAMSWTAVTTNTLPRGDNGGAQTFLVANSAQLDNFRIYAHSFVAQPDRMERQLTVQANEFTAKEAPVIEWPEIPAPPPPVMTKGTTAERDALAAVANDLHYNTDTHQLEHFIPVSAVEDVKELNAAGNLLTVSEGTLKPKGRDVPIAGTQFEALQFTHGDERPGMEARTITRTITYQQFQASGGNVLISDALGGGSYVIIVRMRQSADSINFNFTGKHANADNFFNGVGEVIVTQVVQAQGELSWQPLAGGEQLLKALIDEDLKPAHLVSTDEEGRLSTDAFVIDAGGA